MSGSFATELLRTDGIASVFIAPEFPREITDRFTTVELIGSNELGDTILLSEKNTKELYVLKSQRSKETAAGNEAELLNGLEHKGLLKFDKVIEHNETRYILRKYVNGESLNDYLAGIQNVDPAQAIDTLISLCDILIYLHSQPEPIIHRDIKPSNIIFDPETNAVTLIDFGISRKYSDTASSDTTYFGTHKYAPPEQYGFAQTDARTDIYSLGMVMRYWLTGSQESNAVITIKALEKIASRCTAFAPEMRYQSATALKKALLRYKNRVLRRFIYAAGSVACVLIIGLSIYSIYGIGETPAPPNKAPDIPLIENPVLPPAEPPTETPADTQDPSPSQFPYEFEGDLSETGNFTYWRDIPKSIIDDAEVMVVEYTGTVPNHASAYAFAKWTEAWSEFFHGHERITEEPDRLLFDMRWLDGNKLAFAFWDTLYDQKIERMYITSYALLGSEAPEYVPGDTVDVMLVARDAVTWKTHTSDVIVISENKEYTARVELGDGYPGFLNFGIISAGADFSNQDDMMENASFAPDRFRNARISYDSITINDEIFLGVSRNNGYAVDRQWSIAYKYIYSPLWNAWDFNTQLLTGVDAVNVDISETAAVMFKVPDINTVTSIEVKFTISGVVN